MERRQYHINMSAPNLINICVDEDAGGEISGRLYHRFQKRPSEFSNLMQMIRLMENLFDELSFPQASTMSRSFFQRETEAREEMAKVICHHNLMHFAGREATLLVSVRFRQNSTWQGELFWVEGGEVQNFFSTLDFIKIIDKILSYDED